MPFYVYFRRWPGFPPRFPFEEFMPCREDCIDQDIRDWVAGLMKRAAEVADERGWDWEEHWATAWNISVAEFERSQTRLGHRMTPVSFEHPSQLPEGQFPTPGPRIPVLVLDSLDTARRITDHLNALFCGPDQERPFFSVLSEFNKQTGSIWQMMLQGRLNHPAATSVDRAIRQSAIGVVKAMAKELTEQTAQGATKPKVRYERALSQFREVIVRHPELSGDSVSEEHYKYAKYEARSDDREFPIQATWLRYVREGLKEHHRKNATAADGTHPGPSKKS